MTVKPIIVEWTSQPITVDLSTSLPIVVAVQAVGAAGVKGDAGVSDHGALTGLGDDDHTQYHNDTRGDARYYLKGAVDTALTNKADKATSLAGYGITNAYTKTEADAKYQLSLGFTPENVVNRNAINGYAGLDGTGKVAAAQLPSFVDDVIEAANFAALPGTGETGKIYVTLDNGKTWRWSGSAYVEISASPGSTDAVSEGVTNLYHTAARVNALISASVGSVTQAWNATLDALAAVATTVFGRSLLTMASAAALRTAVSLPTSTTVGRLARYTDTAGAQGQTAGIFEDASGNIGVGTTGPSVKFQVVGGNVRLDGSVAMGGGAIDANSGVSIAFNRTDPATFYQGISVVQTMVLTANNANQLWGINATAGLSNNAFNATGIMRAVEGTLSHSGTGTISTGYGVNGILYNTAAGAVTNGSAVRGAVQNNNASGIIASGYCFNATVPFNNGTITNTYGFYCGDVTQGTQTNQAYAFYNSDANARSYFAGNTGFGTITAPTTTIDSSGPIRARSFTVATLPSASTSGAGAHTHVTDASLTYAAGIGTTVAGGGANFVRVTSDGTNWKIM